MGRVRAIASSVVGGVLLASAITLVASAGPAGAAAAEVPVVGRTVLTATGDKGQPRVVMLVHGLRRIPGGTALYYSVAAPPGGSPVAHGGVIDPTRWIPGRMGDSALTYNYLADLKHRRGYGGLVDQEGNAFASPTKAWSAEPGKFHVLFQIFPELPADTTSVDLVVGQGVVIPSIPVADGALEPASKQSGPMLTGSAWPVVDASGATDVAESAFPLDVESSSLDGSVTQRESGRQVSVDLSTEVLFAVDSATLTPVATERIRKAAATVNQRASSGTIRVVGHTDNTGSTAHNTDLSKRRAASVAAVLKPLVTVSGVSVVVEGKGESEPVASNSTPEGRQANRRVSVVFTAKS